MYDQVYPASITKIMTALLAMEYNQPDTQVTITEEDLALEDGSQMSGLAVGDTVTMDQLFHALLIYSANDLCYGDCPPGRRKCREFRSDDER